MLPLADTLPLIWPMSHLFSSGFLQDLIQNYGLWLVFLFVMLESTGVPMPGETALVTAALYAGSTGRLDIWWVVPTAAAAAIIGDNCGYLVGRWLGLPVLKRYGHYIHLTDARLKIGQYLFKRHGGKIVFFGRFVAFLRAFAAMLAGVNQMHWLPFLVMNGLGGICWATLFGGGAYLFGKAIERVAGPVGIVLLVLAVAGIAAGYLFFRKHEHELEARALAAAEAQRS